MLANYASFHNTCHVCVCILESPGIRGEGFSDVPQILGWVQQRSWLHGLLVQVTLLPLYVLCFYLTDKVFDISQSLCWFTIKFCFFLFHFYFDKQKTTIGKPKEKAKLLLLFFSSLRQLPLIHNSVKMVAYFVLLSLKCFSSTYEGHMSVFSLLLSLWCVQVQLLTEVVSQSTTCLSLSALVL